MCVAWQTVLRGNPGPEGFQLNGVTFPVYVVGPKGPLLDSKGLPARVLAEWDNGSEITSADAPILAAVGAPKVGSVEVSTVLGNSEVPTDEAKVVLAPGSYPLSAGDLPILADTLPDGVRVLIGRDVQSMYRFTQDGRAGTWTIQAPAGSMGPPPRMGVLGVLAALVGVAAVAIAAAEVA